MMTNTENENVFRVDWNTSNSNDTRRRELTRRHVLHMPYITNTRNKKMAAWTDIKEILFPSCDKNCEIVLEELKKFLGYPKSEKCMYPCSPRDHVAFLRQFRYVAIGSLLVQINKVDFSHLLWQKVLKRHISPENDNQFCCSPATKTNNIPTVIKDASITVLKLQKIYVEANQNTVQSKDSFVIPAFVGSHGANEPLDHYIPLHLLGNNVPNVRKPLVDFCGRHIVKSDDPDTHCCSVEEARQITIWQFNKLGGWTGHWRHLTTRDLLVSFKSCMHYLEKHCNFLTTTKTSDDSVEIEMKVGTNPPTGCLKVCDVKSKEVKSESCNTLFPNLQGYYQRHIAPKLVTVVPSLLDNKEKCVLEKKRQRIKSPKEESGVKWKIDWIGSVSEKTNKEQMNENSKTTHTISSSQASGESGMPDVKMTKEGKNVVEQRRSTAKVFYDPPKIKNEKQQKSLDSSSATVNRKILKKKLTDDETLMKLVSCNPFKHSIEALKAIREMNLEKERGSLSSSHSQTCNATQKNGNKNDNPKLVCSGKHITMAKSVILPMINFDKMGKKSRASKDQKLKKERLELPKRPQDTSSLGNIKATKEKSLDNSRYNNTKSEVDVNFSKANADATRILSIPVVSPSSENKAKHLSRVDNVQKKKTNSPDLSKHVEGICKTSNRTSAERYHISSSEICEKPTKHFHERVIRSAKSSNHNRDNGILKSNDQSCKKKPLTTRRISFEIDEPTIQSIKTEQVLSAKENENIPKRNWKSKERGSPESDEKARIQGNKEDSSVMWSVGKYENEEKNTQETDAKIERRKDFLDVNSNGDIDDNIFHPKKRWAKHFLDVSSCNVENSDVDKCETASERIPGGKTDEKKQERIKTSDMEMKHSSKCVFKTDVPSEQPNFKQNYTELYLLKDVNIDHEEVVGEKCFNNICPEVITDLRSSPKRSNSFVKEELKSESSTNTDSSVNDDTITIYVESDQYQPPDKCSTVIDTVDSKLNNPKKDFQKSRETNTSEKESQTEYLDVYVDVVNTSDDDIEFLGFESGDSHKVVHMTKKRKKKKKTGTKSVKKIKKSKKGKAKVTKSSCSVDNDTDEISTAIRIQNVIEEQKRILNILTKTKGAELRSSDKTGKRRGKKGVSEKDLRDIEASISRGTSISTPSQLLETVKQSDDLGRKKGIRIKRGNKEEIKQEGSGIIPGEYSDKGVNPAFGIDTFDIGYDVFRDDSGTEIGGLVLHPKFNLPYVLVNGFQYIAMADAYKLFPGCKKSCRLLKNVLKSEAPLHVTQCTWEELYILDLIFYAKGRRLMTGDPLVRLDQLIGRYEELLCAVYQRHATDTKHKCAYTD